MRRYAVIYVDDTLYADLIAELKAGNGVVIDGVTLKDGGGTFTGTVVIGTDPGFGLLRVGIASASESDLAVFRITDQTNNPGLWIQGDEANARVTLTASGYTGAFNMAFQVGNTDYMNLAAGQLTPATDGATSLGVTGNRWGAAWVGALTATDGTFIGTVKAGDGGTTNYAEIKSDGEINLYGTARVWKPQNLEPARVKLPGANPPAEDTIGGFPFHRYNRGTEESVYYQWEVPEDFAVGDASIRGFFGLVVENPPVSPAGDEVVVMGFEYKKLSPGDVFSFTPGGETSGTVNTTIEEDETALTYHHSATGTCTTTGWAVHDTILFRFYRDATNPADTYDNEASADDNDAWVNLYHLEYLSDKLGEAS